MRLKTWPEQLKTAIVEQFRYDNKLKIFERIGGASRNGKARETIGTFNRDVGWKVGITVNGESYQVSVARIIWFLMTGEDDVEIRFRDNDKSNVDFDNLIGYRKPDKPVSEIVRPGVVRMRRTIQNKVEKTPTQNPLNSDLIKRVERLRINLLFAQNKVETGTDAEKVIYRGLVEKIQSDLDKLEPLNKSMSFGFAEKKEEKLSEIRKIEKEQIMEQIRHKELIDDREQTNDPSEIARLEFEIKASMMKIDELQKQIDSQYSEIKE